jgi:hypothetical protein
LSDSRRAEAVGSLSCVDIGVMLFPGS